MHISWIPPKAYWVLFSLFFLRQSHPLSESLVLWRLQKDSSFFISLFFTSFLNHSSSLFLFLYFYLFFCLLPFFIYFLYALCLYWNFVSFGSNLSFPFLSPLSFAYHWSACVFQGQSSPGFPHLCEIADYAPNCCWACYWCPVSAGGCSLFYSRLVCWEGILSPLGNPLVLLLSLSLFSKLSKPFLLHSVLVSL